MSIKLLSLRLSCILHLLGSSRERKFSGEALKADLGMSDDELADYLDMYANSGTGQPLKAGGVGWYDSIRGVTIKPAR
jgi:hypothetical protein